ncbi:MAG: 3'(2'),5'-bisphosphate nucleotidase CysQ [Alphaproteobacteria bacterium]|nr:3'(2'),5'-bisphosphate nucleotidase CysQ [Alphaproteobacteria bacterium]
MTVVTPKLTDSEAVLAAVADLAQEAAARIMEIYARGFDVDAKADKSPVTEADLESERVILAGLGRLTPDLPVVSEEAVEAGRIPDVTGGRFWLVDPLDGTREFVNRRDEFTVNIGLVEDGLPVLGIVGVPAKDTVYGACGPGTAWVSERGAPPQPITTRPAPASGLTVVASRSHGDRDRLSAYLARFKVADQVSAGSAVKFALVASGEADLYPRFGRTMEWDTAAGHAILAAAGGYVETEDGDPLTYGKPDFANPPFIAFGRRE